MTTKLSLLCRFVLPGWRHLRLRDADEMVFIDPSKHGPRSLTYVRVLGWQTLGRNESKGVLSGVEVGTVASAAGHYRPIERLRKI